MYITAHRVRSTSGEAGINGFLYFHGARSISTDLDPTRIAETPPGEVVRQLLSVAPGGNFVDSYLDVVVPDDMEWTTLQRVFEDIVTDLPDEHTRFRKTYNFRDVAIRLYISPRVPSNPRVEFQALSIVVLRLNKNEPPATAEPIIIERTTTASGFEFRLLHESKTRLEQAIGREIVATEITIESDTLHAFQLLRGSIFPHIVTALVDIDMHEVTALGGLMIRDANTKQRLWSTPADEDHPPPNRVP